MKLVTFKFANDAPQLGVVLDNKIINLNTASNGRLPSDMRSFLQMGDTAMDLASDVVANAPDGVGLDVVKLMSPITDPSKIIAIGLNYMDHIRESGIGMPDLATMFCKYPSSIIGSGEDISWLKGLTDKVDY